MSKKKSGFGRCIPEALEYKEPFSTENEPTKGTLKYKCIIKMFEAKKLIMLFMYCHQNLKTQVD